MNPEFYSLEMLVACWAAGAQGHTRYWVHAFLADLAEENNL